MESAEKDCGVLGSLFQTIINDLRSSSPIWEDFIYKATKLHQCLKTTLGAISAFLEAFQKVADMATNSKGATKEIGSALTRLCMRHKSIETCLKALTSSILDSLVAPLQEKLEDWKKVVAQLDKDHAKEYKKARHEIKKAASDTMRLQKKVKKGKNEMQARLDHAMQDVNAKYQQLELAEKNSVRMALIEERGRFCLFISCIKPFVDHEVHLLGEVTHLQEIMQNLCLQASEPNMLPAASEQVLTDLKGLDPATFSMQPSPPSSPSSLGSRKSSMCSINSINSSSSGSSKSHSPSHTMHKRTASQASNSDRDSTGTDTADCDSTPTTPSANFVPTPTGPPTNTNSLPHPSSAAAAFHRIDRNRPHTISAGSEKHYASRPSVKPELFEPLPEKVEQGEGVDMRDQGTARGEKKVRPHSTSTGPYARPAATINKMQPVLPPHCPRPKVKAVPPPTLPPGAQPVYANTMDLHRAAMENQARQQQEGEATTPTTTPASLQAAQMQQNSLELAAAIRELEESTAALQSTYDSSSHTSHTSLQCSSGYATMNSTPSGSEDTIASGGVPASGTNLSRRSSVNTSKPPPPVRRTASITSTSSTGSSSRSSPPRQMSEAGFNDSNGVPQAEGAYAELQLIQQSIHQRKIAQQPPTLPKPGPLHRQQSNEGAQHPHHVSPDRASISSGSSGGSSHYAVPNITPTSPGQASLIQSLNAKFASLNQQYQDPPYQQQQQQQVVSSDGATYIGGGHGGAGDPSAACLMPPPAAPPNTQGQNRGQGHNHPKQAGHHLYYQQGHPQAHPGQGHHPGPPGQVYHQGHLGQGHPPGHGHPGQGHYQGQPDQGHHPGQGHHQGHPGHGHHPGQTQHQGHPGQGHRQGHSGGHHPGIQHAQGHGGGEDFPLPPPPSAEELAELEAVYARPPPVNPKPSVQANLMMELKRRVSHDEASDV